MQWTWTFGYSIDDQMTLYTISISLVLFSELVTLFHLLPGEEGSSPRTFLPSLDRLIKGNRPI